MRFGQSSERLYCTGHEPKNSGKVILIGNSLGSLVALTCTAV